MSKKTAKNNIINVKELRQKMPELIERVNQGESFTVFKRSKPAFKLSPIDDEESRWETVIDFTKVKKGGVHIDELISRLQLDNGKWTKLISKSIN